MYIKIIKMKSRVVIALLGVFLAACQPEGRVYVEHEELSPDVEWLKKDSREFKVPIEDKEQEYKMSLSFRYANGYQFNTADVIVKEISPSGKEEMREYSLKIRDENGEYIGDAGYDIWDSEHLVEKSKKYNETGEYTYIIEHNMPTDPLYFAMEIGLILDKK